VTYLPELLGLSTAFCYGTADFLSRRQSQRVGYYRTTVYVYVATVAALLLLLPILRPPIDFTALSSELMLVVGIVFFFTFVLLYRALQRGVVSVVAPIAYTYPAVTTVLAVILLGAVLTFRTALALAAIIVGVVLLSTKFSELRDALNGKGPAFLTVGVGSAVMAALAFGSVYLCVGYVTPIVGYFVPVLFLRSVGTVTGFAAAPIMKESVKPDRASLSGTVVAMGVLEAVGFLSFSFAVSLGGGALPIVAALSGMGAAVVIIYAMVFLHERLEPNQLVGVLLSLVGVFALLYLVG
jgi:drug/metabolite transporter (DMT)-like permease